MQGSIIVTIGAERQKGRLMEAESLADAVGERRPYGKAGSADLKELTRRAVDMGKAREYGPMAVRKNTQILEKDPANYGALIRRGRCYWEQDDLLAAKKDYSRVLRIRPGDKLAEEALEKIESGWAAWEEREKRWAEKRVERARAEAEKARAEAEKLAKDLREVEAITQYRDAYNLGVATSKVYPPNYALAEMAFKRAWELDPKKRFQEAVSSGSRMDPKLFEVPTRLARVYRGMGALDRARRIYEWVLKHVDDRYAMVGLAAVQEESGLHAEALELYEVVLSWIPRDSFALRGRAKVLRSLGRIEESVEAYRKAVEDGDSQEGADTALYALERMRADLQRKGETDRVRWLDSVLRQLRDSSPPEAKRGISW